MEDESRRRRSGSGSGSLLQPTGSLHASGNGYKQAKGEGSDQSAISSSEDLEMDDMRSDEEDLDDDEETGLTHSERKKRRRRKDKNSRLDERIAGGGNDSGMEKSVEEKLVTATVLRNLITNTMLIMLWYSFSISISVYNKWMFSEENLNFHYPLFTTSLHMLVQFSLASAVLYFIPRFRPGADSLSAEHTYQRLDGAENETSESTTNKPTPPPSTQPLMTKWFYLSRIGPCGTATALDIGLGNFSLRFISLTFFTMCKSSVLAFVLLFAFIFRLERPTWTLCAIILLMTSGVIMMVAGETAFDALGFILVMTASFCSGFRWSLTQILLLRNRATSNPFSSIFFLTPIMFLALFCLALPIEGPHNLVRGIHELSATSGALLSICILLFPGFLAFLMVAAEFALLKRTSVVTLSVCGIFKEVLTISAAGIVFGDELSPINVSGLVVTIASIAGYNYLKYTKMKHETEKHVHEILVEGEDADMMEGERAKGSDVGDDDRGDSSTPLMRDQLDLVTDVDNDVGHEDKANGVLGSPSKRTKDIEQRAMI